MNDQDIDDVIKMLDNLTAKDVSRIKIQTEPDTSGSVSQEPEVKHHHGRCDIGSPWACGTAFDVLE